MYGAVTVLETAGVPAPDSADLSTDTLDWRLDGMRTALHINLRELFEEALA